MRYIILCILVAFFSLTSTKSQGQALKTNLPLILVGSPNIGFEYTLGNQFSLNADILWTPYLFKKSESVFRVLQTSAEFRYYFNPKYYYTNNMFDGFYIGPYLMYGNYNVGINKHAPVESNDRYVGWGVSAGLSIGYKLYLSRRFRLDFNLGVGYAHLEYDTYYLGGEFSEQPYKLKNTKGWIGPTKFGIHLVYNFGVK